MRSRVVVVTGTGTGVGKTVTTAALAATLARSRSVAVVKPVQTGIGPGSEEESDVQVVARLAGCVVHELATLADPLAPDTAARRSGASLPSVRDQATRIRSIAQGHDTVLVEGAGGLLVRLDSEGGTVLDLAALLGGEVVVVTTPGLGTLNHTELTVAALRGRGIEPTALVVGAWPRDPGLAERCNLEDLPAHTGVILGGLVPAGAGGLAREEFARLAPSWWTATSWLDGLEVSTPSATEHRSG